MTLLERETDLAALETAFKEAGSGRGRIVLVCGEAGIGKTALLDEFARRARERAAVLIGRCDPLITPTPLGPLHDIARLASDGLASLLAAGAPRIELFSAVLDRLRQPDRRHVLVLEDMHWADEATLDLAGFLARRIATTAALVVLTFRDDEIGDDHPLRRLLGSLATVAALRRIQLSPLSRDGVLHLIGDRRLDADALHRATGGNPFYLGEIIASPGGGLPATIRDAVLARFARLGPEGRQLVEQLAVLGTRVERRILARLTQFGQQAFDLCLASGIVRGDADGIAFRHELARVGVLEAINPARRRDCARVALALLSEADGSESPGALALLAHHAEEAADTDATIEYGAKAGEAATALGAHREAAAHFRRVVRAAIARPATERAGHFLALARACSLLDRLDEAARSFRQSIELYREAADPLREGAAQAEFAWTLVRDGRNAEAEAASRAAIDLLADLPKSRELAAAFRVQAHLRMLNRERAPAERWGTKAIRLATRLGDLRIVAEAELVVGSALLADGDDRGRVALDRCLAIARAQGFDPLVALAHSNAGSLYGEHYRFAEAERELTTGLAFARSRDLDLATFYMMAWMSLTRLYQGRWSEAAATAEAIIAEPRCAAISRIMALVALGRVHARRGDPRSTAVLDEALALAERTDTLQRLAPVRSARAEAAWFAGDTQRMAVEARAAYALALRHQHRWHAGEMAFWQGLAGADVAMPPFAATPFALQHAGEWRQAAATWRRLGCPFEEARALADGDLEAQHQALDAFARLGAEPAAAALRRRMRQAGVRSLPRGPRVETRDNRFGLTPRQAAILAAMTEGLSNKAIAARLKVSPKTIDHHVSAVLAKLGVATRHEAVRIAKDEDTPAKT